MKRFLLAVLFFAILLVIWEALFRARVWSPVLLPSPRQVVVYLEGVAVDGTLLKATIVTMRRLLIGYIIGLVVGLPLGLLTARWKVWQDTIGTLNLGLQGLPSVCWAFGFRPYHAAITCMLHGLLRSTRASAIKGLAMPWIQGIPA